MKRVGIRFVHLVISSMWERFCGRSDWKNIQARSCLKILMAAFAMSMMVMVFAPMQAEG